MKKIILLLIVGLFAGSQLSAQEEIKRRAPRHYMGEIPGEHITDKDEQQLIDAIIANDAEKVEDIIKKLPEIINKELIISSNENLTVKATPLAFATEIGHLYIATDLLKAGANPNATYQTINTEKDPSITFQVSTLYKAAQYGFVGLVEALRKKGVDPSIGVGTIIKGSYNSLRSPWQVAVEQNNKNNYDKIINLLLAKEEEGTKKIKEEVPSVALREIYLPLKKEIPLPKKNIRYLSADQAILTAIITGDINALKKIVKKNPQLLNQLITLDKESSAQLGFPWHRSIDPKLDKILFNQPNWMHYLPITIIKLTQGGAVKFPLPEDVPYWQEKITALYAAMLLGNRKEMVDYILKQKTTNVKLGYELTFSLNFPKEKTNSNDPRVNYYVKITKSPLFFAASGKSIDLVAKLIGKEAEIDRGYAFQIILAGPEIKRTISFEFFKTPREIAHDEIIQDYLAAQGGYRPKSTLIPMPEEE